MANELTVVDQGSTQDFDGVDQAAIARDMELARDYRASRPAADAPVITNPIGPSVPVTSVSPALVDQIFDFSMPWDGWNGASVGALRAKWGGGAASNVAHALAFADAHADVMAVFDRGGLTGHPAILEAGAILGRKYATQSAPRSAPRQAATTTRESRRGAIDPLDDDAYQAQLAQQRARIEAAQAAGDSRTANRLYQEHLAFIGRREGNQPIVGKEGRTA